MRYIVDFKRYPRAVCVMQIHTHHGIIETPCSDAYLRWLYEHDCSVPNWWLQWRSTQAWLAGLQGERVAIVGSRDYPQLDRVTAYVNTLPMNTVIVSGGAKGVDTAAEQAAKARRMKTVIYPVNTDGLPVEKEARRIEFGKRAYARNADIVKAADRVVAFSHNSSRGTANSIQLARDAGKPVIVFDSNGMEIAA